MQRKHCLGKWNMKNLHISKRALSFWLKKKVEWGIHICIHKFIHRQLHKYHNMSADGYISKPDNFHSWPIIMRMDWLWNWRIRMILLQWNLSVLCIAWSCFWNLCWFIVRWTWKSSMKGTKCNFCLMNSLTALGNNVCRGPSCFALVFSNW